MLLFNPVVIAVILMCILCLFRLNVLLAIIAAALVAGLLSGMNVVDTMSIMIGGMKGNLETALSYVLLGALAVGIARGNFTKILIYKMTKFIDKKAVFLCFFIAFIACFSQNLIPVHIAFIPILIPPLLGLMNKLKIDRRAVACALTFGLEAPYIAIPVGFGLIYHTILRDQMNQNGFNVSLSDVASVMWIGGLGMFFGLVIAILVLYRKPREYREEIFIQQEIKLQNARLNIQDYFTILGIVVAFVTQVYTGSLPFGAFLGLAIMLGGKAIKWNEMDSVLDEGMKMMAFIAFVMLIAAGFAEVLKQSGAIGELVNMTTSMIGGKFGAAVLMLLVGLFITLGIGTSFGTIPVIAAFYCPLCIQLGFGSEATILLLGIAGALGDAGSPASDSTMGPTSGLNADGLHDHIRDTCIPTFIVYNIPLMIFGVGGAMVLG
ncbi:Na+/H+ antiporter NhaC family protein [Helicobacter sp. 13S00477-4]|uniref:Na+/H+ antiporter family protein n=1 Tax=Helicobacter sp. 13S00477-4 TaxID=1905759 RepID=UPI000BA6B055|nr:Na+/H+ antiporter NhaC family protein [Helicobacter sp. 13S00477-4]PAF52484.1 sodium:proton antiporter [Helicobacter sp. 13S00477-4]